MGLKKESVVAIGKRNILIVYVNTKAVMRSSVKDHLNSFRDYPSSRCYYLNLGFWDIPTFIGEIKFDLIVFHHSFLIYKARKEGFDYYIAKAQSLKS